MIGDVNERSEFCQKSPARRPLVSMNGGSAKNPCPVPRFGGPDWMLGSGAEFSDFEKVYNGISDHPALTARGLGAVQELTHPHADDEARPSSARAGLVVV